MQEPGTVHIFTAYFLSSILILSSHLGILATPGMSKLVANKLFFQMSAFLATWCPCTVGSSNSYFRSAG